MSQSTARTSYSLGKLAGTAAVATVGLTGIAAAAQAQEHPVFLPTRDVAVTYQLTGGPGGGGQTTHLYFSAEANKLRIDTPGGAGYTVLDRAAHQQMLVMNAQRAYATTALQPGTEDGFILNSTMTYHRLGQGSVAGIPCTNWSVTSAQANGRACVTDDGVLLSGNSTATGGPQGQTMQTGLTAVSVDYAPQSPSLFDPPAGFRKLSDQEMQQMMQQEGGGPGGPNGGPPGDGQNNGAPPPGYAPNGYPPNGNGQ